jgi:hypothetical protein
MSAKSSATPGVSDDGEQAVLRTPVKAIRAKCLDCCCGQVTEVRRCTMPDCPLYLYRMGHRPAKPVPKAQ